MKKEFLPKLPKQVFVDVNVMDVNPQAKIAASLYYCAGIPVAQCCFIMGDITAGKFREILAPVNNCISEQVTDYERLAVKKIREIEKSAGAHGRLQQEKIKKYKRKTPIRLKIRRAEIKILSMKKAMHFWRDAGATMAKTDYESNEVVGGYEVKF